MPAVLNASLSQLDNTEDEFEVIDKNIWVGRENYTKEHLPAPPASSEASDEHSDVETDGGDPIREVIHSFRPDSPS